MRGRDKGTVGKGKRGEGWKGKEWKRRKGKEEDERGSCQILQTDETGNVQKNKYAHLGLVEQRF